MALTLLAVSGCSAADATPAATSSPTPTSSTDEWESVTLSGTAHEWVKLAVPDGAHSLAVDIACTSAGMFTISTGDEFLSSRSGGCGGVSALVLPLPESGVVMLDVSVTDGGAFTLTGEFEEADNAVDASIVDQCAALSTSATFIHNAEDGFQRGEIDAARWRALVAEASTAVDSVPTTGSALIVAQLPALVAAYARTDLSPGAFWSYPSVDGYGAAADLVAQACDSNGSPITIMAQYGG